jgi:predicted Zn finger-like uncharacterized protein
MKFLCGSCRTKYQISDEKVRGKILTIRCKKCGAKILVRESLSKNAGGGTAVAPVAEEEQPKAAEISGKQKSVAVAAKAGGSAALASAFEVAMGGGTTEADDMPTSIAPVPANLDNAGVEWYVAIDGEQFGPYAFAEIVRRIVSKEVVGRHYVWHDGMDNWLRVRDVKDLAPYIPSDKKKPPPPPPPVSGEHHHHQLHTEDETVAAGGAEIVDLSLRRAERERHKPSIKPEKIEEEQKPSARADERAEQLDSVLNEALGIENEGRTTRETPERAIAVSGTARTKEGHAEPSIDDLLAFESKEDDLFANVPRATDADLVRESTRFFVAAAGMNARKSKHKVAMVLGGVLAMMFVGFVGAWAGGIIRIELPGIGNPFAGMNAKSWLASEEEQYGDEEEDPEAIGRMLSDKEKRAAAARKKKRRSKGTTGYVDDGVAGGPSGTRGGEEGSLDVDMGGSGPGNFNIPDSKLPESGIEDVQVDGAESLSADVIKKVVDARKRSVLICYQQSLKGQEDLRGKLEIRVTVAPTGEVKSATVETSAFKGSKLGRCIASKIQDWRFPSFSGEAQQILVPFVLEKGNDY